MEMLKYVPYIFVTLIVIYIGARLITYAYFKSKIDFVSFINNRREEINTDEE
tara:strand:- start:32 stop:187 length:156 start_codon:yes stop_codon:yes gene_type:complete